ncbi:hypothetical protein ACFQXA_18080 [Nocardiopsis composta]
MTSGSGPGSASTPRSSAVSAHWAKKPLSSVSAEGPVVPAATTGRSRLSRTGVEVTLTATTRSGSAGTSLSP